MNSALIHYLIREGNGTPLQYSCLENPMDGGAWWAVVHGSLRVRHDWETSLSLFTFMYWRRKLLDASFYFSFPKQLSKYKRCTSWFLRWNSLDLEKSAKLSSKVDCTCIQPASWVYSCMLIYSFLSSLARCVFQSSPNLYTVDTVLNNWTFLRICPFLTFIDVIDI